MAIGKTNAQVTPYIDMIKYMEYVVSSHPNPFGTNKGTLLVVTLAYYDNVTNKYSFRYNSPNDQSVIVYSDGYINTSNQQGGHGHNDTTNHVWDTSRDIFINNIKIRWYLIHSTSTEISAPQDLRDTAPDAYAVYIRNVNIISNSIVSRTTHLRCINCVNTIMTENTPYGGYFYGIGGGTISGFDFSGSTDDVPDNNIYAYEFIKPTNISTNVRLGIGIYSRSSILGLKSGLIQQAQNTYTFNTGNSLNLSLLSQSDIAEITAKGWSVS